MKLFSWITQFFCIFLHFFSFLDNFSFWKVPGLLHCVPWSSISLPLFHFHFHLALVVATPLVMPESCRYFLSTRLPEATQSISGGYCPWAREKRRWRWWRRLQRWTAKRFRKIQKLSMTQDFSKVPKEVYDSVLSLAEKQKQERANTWEKLEILNNIAGQLNTWEKPSFAILIILCFHTRAPPSYMDLFRTKEMRVITILITILWMLIRSISTKRYFCNSQYFVFSLEFDCTVRNITNLDFSIYVSFCVSFWSKHF